MVFSTFTSGSCIAYSGAEMENFLFPQILEQPIFSHVDRTPEDEEVETMQPRKCLRAYWAKNKRKQQSRLPNIGPPANSDALDQRGSKICDRLLLEGDKGHEY